MTGLSFSVPQKHPLYLWSIIAIALIIRIAATFVLNQPVESDNLAYFTMAKGLVEQGQWLDQYGLHAFYSAGYPLFLSSFFMVFGSSITVAIGVNLLLTIVSMLLIDRIAIRITGRSYAGLIAAIIYAVWFSAIWNATMIAKENLSTALLLALTVSALHLIQTRRPIITAAVAGIIWGAGLITGGSSLLLCLGIIVGLLIIWVQRGQLKTAFLAGLAFTAAAALILSPWLYATSTMVGKPVLTTNAQFNLYIGNNPAANGYFVSISDTPMGKNWESEHVRMGEIGTAQKLQHEALSWIAANPERAAKLAMLKLAYFWAPRFPAKKDFEASKAMATIRFFVALQYSAIVVLGGIAFFSRSIGQKHKWIIGMMVAGFWFIHAPAYIIPRYRDPVIPLLIIMASAVLAQWLGRKNALLRIIGRLR